MMKILCVRRECRNEAEVLPVLRVRPKREAAGSMAGVRVQFGLPCCRRCSLDIGVRELLDQAGARSIAREFIRHWRRAPDFAAATIEWIPLTSQEAKDFIGTIPAPEKGIVIPSRKRGLIH